MVGPPARSLKLRLTLAQALTGRDILARAKVRVSALVYYALRLIQRTEWYRQGLLASSPSLSPS